MSRFRPSGAALLVAAAAACQAPIPSIRAEAAGSARPPAAASRPPSVPKEPASKPATQQDLQESAPTDLEQLLTQSEKLAPGLLVARARSAAAKERAEQAAEWPDPKLRLTWWAEEVQTRSGPMDARIMASQRIPWPGKLDAAAAVAEEQGRVADSDLGAVRLEIRRLATRAWNERVYTERAQWILAAHVELLEEIEKIARAEAEREGMRPASLMRVQVDLGITRDRISTHVERGIRVDADLESLTGVELRGEIEWASADFAEPLRHTEETDQASVVSEHHPLLEAHTARIRAARSVVDVAELAGRPDFELAVDYTLVGDAGAPGVRSGEDPISISLGFELPFGSGADRAREREARALQGARLAEMRGTRLQLDGRLDATRSSLHDAERRVELYGVELIPQAEEALDIAVAAYETRTAPFPEVLDTLRDLLKLRLEALRAEADRAQAHTELDFLLAPSQDWNTSR